MCSTFLALQCVSDAHAQLHPYAKEMLSILTDASKVQSRSYSCLDTSIRMFFGR